jgi:hypothetical protein
VVNVESKELNYNVLNFKKFIELNKNQLTDVLKEAIEEPKIKLKGVRFYFVEENTNTLIKADLFLKSFDLSSYEGDEDENE